jgi:hypothetical protein
MILREPDGYTRARHQQGQAGEGAPHGHEIVIGDGIHDAEAQSLRLQGLHARLHGVSALAHHGVLDQTDLAFALTLQHAPRLVAMAT